MRYVEAGATLLSRAVQRVLIGKGIDAVTFIAAIAFHQSLAEGVGDGEAEAVGEAALQTELQALIPGIPARIQESETGQRAQDAVVADERKGAAGLYSAGGSVKRRIGTVPLYALVEVNCPAAYVSNIQHHATKQTALKVQTPLVHLRLEVVGVEHIGRDGAGGVKWTEWIRI